MLSHERALQIRVQCCSAAESLPLLPAERLVLRLRPRRKKVWVIDTLQYLLKLLSRFTSHLTVRTEDAGLACSYGACRGCAGLTTLWTTRIWARRSPRVSF